MARFVTEGRPSAGATAAPQSDAKDVPDPGAATTMDTDATKPDTADANDLAAAMDTGQASDTSKGAPDGQAGQKMAGKAGNTAEEAAAREQNAAGGKEATNGDAGVPLKTF